MTGAQNRLETTHSECECFADIDGSDQENMIADVRQRVNDALAALRTAEGALASVREAILDCRDRAMFSSKEIVVKHVAERLPSINAALAEIRKALEGK